MSAQPLPDLWACIPFLDNWAMTEQAVLDLLEQHKLNVRVALVNQASDDESRAAMDRFLLRHQTDAPRVVGWTFNPRLPLSAVWNRFMAFLEEIEEPVGWIVNNDVRLHPDMGHTLLHAALTRRALFVSGVGTSESGATSALYPTEEGGFGGPDFSCFLYLVDGWKQYPFDENFPAYCEDLDLHRRMLLDGAGQRIFSINAPYHHLGSGTLNQSDQHRELVAKVSAESRAYYRRKWGGAENQETYPRPFTPMRPDDEPWDVRTSALFDQERQRFAAPDPMETSPGEPASSV